MFSVSYLVNSSAAPRFAFSGDNRAEPNRAISHLPAGPLPRRAGER